ncbi:MAG: DNA polymerase III subunit gamma/tau [Christensenella sp.]|nr:DNA polymerase III subunit gamma/tau [Christensenella sp.]
MAYRTLYRVFRPSSFDEVYGQRHITDILKRQVITGRHAHAYLFYGPRGTGKTSTAKILANALNCLNPQNGNPCGACEVCKSFQNDAFVDIVEIDAASNNSVDNVRDIREKVSLLPAAGKYKVYIIDEVHMLSTGAFNALLKTLEEPPPHAVFILATTEIRKLPGTILSRCQRYDFKRIAKDDIVARLKEVADKSEIEYEEEAIAMIAQAAEGGMRDALSIMDQCIAGKKTLTLPDVNAALGTPDSALLGTLCDAVSEENASQAMSLLQTMLQNGTEAHNILRDMIVEYSARLAKNVGDAYQCANLLRVIETLIGCQNTLRYAPSPDAVLIAAVVRAATNTVDVDTTDFELRIKKLEQRVEKLAAGLAKGELIKAAEGSRKKITSAGNELQSAPVSGQGAVEQLEKAEQAEKKQDHAEKDTLNHFSEGMKEFKKLVGKEIPVLEPVVKAIKKMELRGSILDLYADETDSVLVEMLKKEEYAAQMAELTAKAFGRPMAIDIVYRKKEAPKEEKSMEEQLAALVGKDKVVIK